MPGSIAEITPYTLGGLEQWVMIRGASVENPALVLVHGGPGFPEMRLFRHFNSALEQMFTVVFWEQRGTGKSYSRRARKSPMTVERFINDLDELVDRVRERLGKDTVTIYGHSWGSALGILYAARFPEKVAAYVGTGQIGDWPASEHMTYEFTLAEAERRGDARAIRQLRKVGPPPHTAQQMEVQRKWLTRYVGIARGKSLWEILRVVLGRPESSVLDLSKLLRGMLFSGRAMWAEVSQLNLELLVPEVRVPVFFFPGRHDRVVDPSATVAYFDKLLAPSKQLLWFEESSHEPPIEEPDKFLQAMAELVWPVSVTANDTQVTPRAR